jgi:hypothetical protein
MIAFTRIPYNEANDIAVKQEKLLDSIVTFVSRATKLSLLLAAVYGYLKYTKKIN